MVAVTCSRIWSVPETGRWYVQFTDGTQLEFQSKREMLEFGSELDDPAQQGREMAQRLFVRWWLARSADGSNTSPIVGKTLTFDLSNNTAIRVQ